MQVEMNPAEVWLLETLRAHFTAPNAPVRRCDEDVFSENVQLYANCIHPDQPEGIAVLLGERLDWRLPQAGISLNFGQVQAGRCHECGNVLYTLL